MNTSKEQRNKYLPLIFAILIHLAVALIFVYIRFGKIIYKSPDYATINFSYAEPLTKTIKVQQELPEKKAGSEKYPPVKSAKKTNAETVIIPDTSKVNAGVPAPNISENDSSYYLKYARSILDTFLIKHPNYAAMILREQAKNIGKKSYRGRTLEQRINDELNAYLKKNLPEGTEHQINPYTGPGLNIPIDDLIDLIGKIFK